jgi:peptidoglycan/xylan/chitin deacetylase (PgdA/CDA1 family)
MTTTGSNAPEHEHSHFSYSPIMRRPSLRLPGEARLALSIVLHFECMDFGVASETVKDPRWRERIQPDPRHYSWYEYGNRVAMFRILDLLDRLNLRVTVAANALACERYPYLVGEFLRRGYEIAAHGHAANSMVSSVMSNADEKALIADVVARIEMCSEQPVEGWISQDYGQSPSTPALLSEAGLKYMIDWPNDDQPFAMTGAGGIVSIPAAFELDDMRLFIDRKMQAWRYPDMVANAAACLLSEGVEQPRILPLSIHPWVFGAPHRFRYLVEALHHLANNELIWNATGRAITRHINDGVSVSQP